MLRIPPLSLAVLLIDCAFLLSPLLYNQLLADALCPPLISATHPSVACPCARVCPADVVGCAIPGCRTPAQPSSNAAAAVEQPALSAETMVKVGQIYDKHIRAHVDKRWPCITDNCA